MRRYSTKIETLYIAYAKAQSTEPRAYGDNRTAAQKAKETRALNNLQKAIAREGLAVIQTIGYLATR